MIEDQTQNFDFIWVALLEEEAHMSTHFAENCALLDCYTASSVNFLLMFWDNLSGPIMRNQESWPLKVGPIGCPKTLVWNYHYLLCNNPEERSSHLLRARSLKSHIMHFSLQIEYTMIYFKNSTHNGSFWLGSTSNTLHSKGLSYDWLFGFLLHLIKSHDMIKPRQCRGQILSINCFIQHI
jgi:hypothetical protein